MLRRFCLEARLSRCKVTFFLATIFQKYALDGFIILPVPYFVSNGLLIEANRPKNNGNIRAFRFIDGAIFFIVQAFFLNDRAFCLNVQAFFLNDGAFSLNVQAFFLNDGAFSLNIQHIGLLCPVPDTQNCPENAADREENPVMDPNFV